VQFHARRVDRAQVPSGDAFTAWLDDQWVRVDHDVHLLLHPELVELHTSEGNP
jgi:hypothetical protein